jgi:hypothetical protein
MKKTNLFLVILTLISLVFTSCLTTKTITNGKQIDKRLVGIWQGSEKDQQVLGIEKKWEMNRKKNGTFSIIFTTIQEGKTDKFIEKGNWWVEGNIFFEYHKNSGKKDTYKFTILNEEQVKFEIIYTDFDFAEPNYSFIDTKVSNSNSKKVKRDGLTPETAIKVKSVSEEYEYIRENCQNCQLLSQSLIEYNGKRFDKITLKNSDGKEVSFFFDINSFFGKMW